jgi:predicted RND superfamily exporter protein
VILDWLARLVTRRRGLVVGALLVLTLGLASQIPKIETEPAVENLISSFEGRKRDATSELAQWFGPERKVILLLVEADDVLEPKQLERIHDLSLRFSKKPWVDHVDSITDTPIAHRVPKEPEEEEVPTEDSLDLDDLDTLEEEETDSDVFNALLDIIESDPERFSGGIARLGPELSAELQTAPIISQETVTTEQAAELEQALEAAPLLTGRLISKDRTVAAIVLHLKDLTAEETLSAARETEADLEATGVHIGGLPYLRSTIIEKMRLDNLRLIPIVVLVCVLLLLVSFRWLPGALLPVAAVGMTSLMVVGGMAIVGEPMNVLNNIIVPLLIIVGISEAIYLIGRYWEEVLKTGNPDQAARKTVHSMTVACFLTTATIAVGLASHAVTRTPMLRHFGITAGLGVMVGYVVTITFLPALLTWARPPRASATHQWEGWTEGFMMKLTTKVLNRPQVVLLASIGFFALCAYGARNLVVDHALLDQFDQSDPVYLTTRLLEDKLDGVRPLDVVLESTEDTGFYEPNVIEAIEKVKRWAEAHPGVIRAMSHGDILHETLSLVANDATVRNEPFRSEKQVAALATLVAQRNPNPLASWLSPDKRRARLQIKLRDIGAQATLRFVGELESEMRQELPPGISFSFAGEAYTSSLGQEAIVRDLLASVTTTILVIFMLLATLLRSVRLALISIPPSVIPLIATMFYMVMRGIPLNVSTVIIFSISLGLAVDGTIQFLARFREEIRSGAEVNEVLLRAARGTGRAIIVSCVTLMAGFGVMIFSSFVPVRQFGELIAVTSGGCLLATFIVLPALLKLVGVSRSAHPRHAMGPDSELEGPEADE